MTTNPTQAQRDLVQSIRKGLFLAHNFEEDESITNEQCAKLIADHVAEEVAKATAWQPLTDDTSGGKYLFGVWCDGKWYQAYGNLRVGGFLVPVGFRKYKNATHYIVPTPPTEQEG